VDDSMINGFLGSYQMERTPSSDMLSNPKRKGGGVLESWRIRRFVIDENCSMK